MIHPDYQTTITVEHIRDTPLSIVCKHNGCETNAYPDEGPELFETRKPFANCKNKITREEDYHCYYFCAVGHIIDAIIVIKQGNKVIH